MLNIYSVCNYLHFSPLPPSPVIISVNINVYDTILSPIFGCTYAILLLFITNNSIFHF